MSITSDPLTKIGLAEQDDRRLPKGMAKRRFSPLWLAGALALLILALGACAPRPTRTPPIQKGEALTAAPTASEGATPSPAPDHTPQTTTLGFNVRGWI